MDRETDNSLQGTQESLKGQGTESITGQQGQEVLKDNGTHGGVMARTPQEIIRKQ